MLSTFKLKILRAKFKGLENGSDTFYRIFSMLVSSEPVGYIREWLWKTVVKCPFVFLGLKYLKELFGGTQWWYNWGKNYPTEERKLKYLYMIKLNWNLFLVWGSLVSDSQLQLVFLFAVKYLMSFPPSSFSRFLG